MEREALISNVIWQAAAESVGLPVYGRNWSMENYNHACNAYDRIMQTSYDKVAAAVAQSISVAVNG